MNKLIVFTDGSCINNGKSSCKAGYGVYFPNKEFKDVSLPIFLYAVSLVIYSVI